MSKKWICVSMVSSVLGLMAGCAGSDGVALDVEQKTESIVGGTAFSDLPAVGAITYRGGGHCTGTLISPTRVLTAAHCVQGFRASSLRFLTGPNQSRPVTSTAVSSTRVHPSLDIATLELASAPSGVTPISVLAAGELDSSWVGVDLLHVGYGFTSSAGTGAGTKRAVLMPIEQVNSTAFAYGGDGRNTCNGDSGGPALFRTTSGNYLVVGVTSYGDEDCTVYGVDVRADVALSFLEVTGGDPGSTGGGGTTPSGATPETITDGNTLARSQSVAYDAIPVRAGSPFRAALSGTGDADLYVQWGARPTGTSYACRPFTDSANEVCDLTVPSGVTTAYVIVNGYTASTYEIGITHTP